MRVKIQATSIRSNAWMARFGATPGRSHLPDLLSRLEVEECKFLAKLSYKVEGSEVKTWFPFDSPGAGYNDCVSPRDLAPVRESECRIGIGARGDRARCNTPSGQVRPRLSACEARSRGTNTGGIGISIPLLICVGVLSGKPARMRGDTSQRRRTSTPSLRPTTIASANPTKRPHSRTPGTKLMSRSRAAQSVIVPKSQSRM